MHALRLFVAASVLVAARYGRTLAFGFDTDDYWTLRPWTASDVRESLTGTWDPTGSNEAYYRPVAALYQAGSARLFGYDARALRWLSLIELAGVAWLLGVLILREDRRWWTAACGIGFYLLHPLTATSTVAWIFVQMHLLVSAAVLLALIAWQRCRTRSVGAWWLVALPIVVGSFIKEEVAMLVPAIVILQVIWRRWFSETHAPLRAIVAGALAVGVVIAAVRLAFLPVFGGDTLLGAPWSETRLLSALYRAFVNVRDAPLASVFVATCFVLGLVSFAVPSLSRERRLAALGGVVMVFVAIPLAVAGGMTRAHLIVVAGAPVLCAGLSTAFSLLSRRGPRALCVVAAAFGALGMAGAVTRALDSWAPCAPDTLERDREVVEYYPAVAPAVKQWLREKPAFCARDEPFPPIRWE
jgi:hypothetical protein